MLTSTTLLAACGDDAVTPSDDTGSSSGDTGTTMAPDDTGSSGQVDSSSGGEQSTGDPEPVCGNGILEDGEACDDSNEDVGDGCDAACAVEEGFACEGDPSVCAAVCGDGIVLGEESCDDENEASNDGCNNECQTEEGFACEGEPSVCATVCGDGLVVDREECDDANSDLDDGCDDMCVREPGWFCEQEPSLCVPICGDGVILGDEECDDDNFIIGDGCSNTCETELGWSCEGEPSLCMTGCGDGIIAGTEICDDSNPDSDDGCSDECDVEDGWTCMGEPSVCATECGDGLIAGTEVCDDGGIVPGDGCDGACLLEPGFACEGEPSVCETDCGDGVIVGTETCDDGGFAQGDGCNESCQQDFGWSCVGAPSVCTETAVLQSVVLGGDGGCVLTTTGDVGCFGDNFQGQVGNGTVNVETFLPAFALDNVSQVAAGEEHHCAIRAGGQVWCWGDNSNRQLGPNTPPGTDQPLAIEVPGMPPVIQVAAGDDHSAALDNLGQVWTWGDNDNRQLGRGGTSTIDDQIPTIVPMPGGLTAIDLGAGENHTCAVLADNTVACWGDDDQGQLGDGASGTDSGDAAVVPGLTTVNDVECGRDETCALDDLGQVWCWGDNIDGQLGDGTTTDSPTPLAITLPAAAEDITLGDEFVCALLVTDEIWCWGEGADFQLANGDIIDSVPSPVLGLPPVNLIDVEAGMRYICATDNANERYCWGYGEEGQMGIAPLNQLVPTDPLVFSGPVQTLVLGKPDFRSAGCGLLLDGTIECFGDGTLVTASTTTGAVGYFEPISNHLTVPTPIPSITGVLELGIGDGFACARTATNVQCWGDNSQRQLGQDGTSTVDIPLPVPVMMLGVVDELSVGDQFACVRTGGTVQCWGDNDNRQTGEDTTTLDQSLPVTVMGLTDAVDIELGEDHACALRSTGAVSCWGEDFSGQLGDDDGITDDSALPLDVTNLPGPASQITVGQDHSCALVAGEVWCWGEGGFGNLGQGNELDSDTAVQVPGLTGINQVVAGWNYNCALDGMGVLTCWGDSADGQLGEGGEEVTGVIEQRSPVPFEVATGVIDIAGGNTSICIETAAGWSCLGFRGTGQLGNGTAVSPAVPTGTMFGI